MTPIKALPVMLAFALAVPAMAQTDAGKVDIAPLMRAAEEKAQPGSYLEALDALDEAALLIWEKMPLAVRKALFVVEEPQGFGIYNVRENAQFDGKTPMLIYAELAGVGWKKSGNLWRTDLQLGFDLRTKAGEKILAQEVFNTIATASRTRNREFFLHVTYSFNGLENGDYVVRTSITDRAGNKKTEFEQEFSVKK